MDQSKVIAWLLRAVREEEHPLLLAEYVTLFGDPAHFLAALYDIAPSAVARLLSNLGRIGAELPALVAAHRRERPESRTVEVLTSLGISTLYTEAWNARLIDEADHVAAITPEVQAALPWRHTREWLGHGRWYLDRDPCATATLRRLLEATFIVDPALETRFWGLILGHLQLAEARRLLLVARASPLTDEVLCRELPTRRVLEIVPREAVWEHVTRAFDVIEAEEGDASDLEDDGDGGR